MFAFFANVGAFTSQFFATIAGWFVGLGQIFFTGVLDWLNK